MASEAAYTKNEYSSEELNSRKTHVRSLLIVYDVCFFFSSRRRHTRCSRDWSSDVCSSDLEIPDNLDFVQAAAVPEVFITAHDALFTQAGLQMGERLLVHAAGSGVCTAADRKSVV